MIQVCYVTSEKLNCIATFAIAGGLYLLSVRFSLVAFYDIIVDDVVSDMIASFAINDITVNDVTINDISINNIIANFNYCELFSVGCLIKFTIC